MNFIFFSLLITNSFLFCGEITQCKKLNPLYTYGFDLGNVIVNNEIQDTKNYDAVKNGKFFLLRMREVCSNFNQLVENSENIQNAISLGNIKNLVPYYFEGFSKRPNKYKSNIVIDLISRTLITTVSGCCIIYPGLNLLQPRYIPQRDFIVSVLGGLIFAYIEQRMAIAQNQNYLEFYHFIQTPYLYLDLKKKQNKYDILTYNFDFVCDKKNVLLSKAFEKTIIQYFFCPKQAWSNMTDDFVKPTVYGLLDCSNPIIEIIENESWPATIEIQSMAINYHHRKKIFKLIDYSDEFNEFEVLEKYDKSKLPFDVIIDISLKSKNDNANFMWSHNLDKIDIQNWFDSYKEKLAGKRVLWRSLNVYRNLEINYDLKENIKLIRDLFRSIGATIHCVRQ